MNPSMYCILVIEDDPAIRSMIKEILETSGYKIEEAKNGKEGIELIESLSPDLILCDIMMPELDGHSVLHEFRKDPFHASIPFIFLTAKAAHADFRKAMELGADDFIIKPFQGEELIKAVESRLKKRKQLDFRNHKLRNSGSPSNSKLDGLSVLKKITKDYKVRHIKKNQIIYYELDSPHGLYFIKEGKVKTIKLDDHSRELTIAIYGKDDYLGISAMFSNEVYSESAIAVEDCQLYLIPKEKIEQIIIQYPEISRQFIKILSHSIGEKENQLVELAFHSAKKRVADSILKLYGQTEQNLGCLKVSREDLATMAGVAGETVSRSLTYFKKLGLIEKKGGMIVILNAERLKTIHN